MCEFSNLSDRTAAPKGDSLRRVLNEISTLQGYVDPTLEAKLSRACAMK